jgi:hypothetical protein
MTDTKNARPPIDIYALTGRVKQQLMAAIFYVKANPRFGCKANPPLSKDADAQNIFTCVVLEYDQLNEDEYLEHRTESAVLALRQGGVDPNTIDLIGFKNMKFKDSLDEFYLQATFVGQGLDWGKPFSKSSPDPWNLSGFSAEMWAYIRGETEQMPHQPLPGKEVPKAHPEDRTWVPTPTEPPDFVKEPHRLLVWFGRRRIGEIMVSKGVDWDKATQIFGEWLKAGG